jgi:hypothetical protein
MPFLADVLSKNYDYDITEARYGGNLRRFLKKARDARSATRFYDAPKIVMIGDSITGGVWAEQFKTYLCDAYNIPLDNFAIHWYGGYRIQDYLSFIEDTLIFPNPDLILFGEYEGFDGYEEELMVIEDIIYLLRERTTADIGIYTWSMSGTDGRAYVNDKTYLVDSVTYQDLNRYRDIAAIYNCELIDVNEAIKKALDNGVSPDKIWGVDSNSVHLADYGYETITLPEFKKHFKLSDNQSFLNVPYPLANKEEEIFLTNANKMNLFSYKEKITLTGTWLQNNKYLESKTVGDTVEIYMEDIIGFEIMHGAPQAASILLKKGDGSYTAPSTFTFNSRPLQYVTEVLSITYSAEWDKWRLKRPFKKGIVTSNELPDGTLVSGQYTIKVISIVGDVVTCEMFNPSSVSLGTFVVGQDNTFVTGNLSFPQKYNGENNYYTYPTIPFLVGEEYEFYIKNNWCDTLFGGEGWNKIIGLERGDYTVKLTISSTSGVNLYKIKLLH